MGLVHDLLARLDEIRDSLVLSHAERRKKAAVDSAIDKAQSQIIADLNSALEKCVPPKSTKNGPGEERQSHKRQATKQRCKT